MTEAAGFYVTVVRAPRRVGYLLGPFSSEPVARAQIGLARHLAEQVDPFTSFDAFGTAKVTGAPLPIGVLNERAGL